MVLIPWDDKYSVNIQKIDEEHHRIIKALNDLYAALNEDKFADAIGEILKVLVDYTQTHFKTEEALFTRYDYPGKEHHQKEHQCFIEKINGFEKEYLNGETVFPMEVMLFLKHWIGNHILVEDKKYSAFLNEKGVV